MLNYQNYQNYQIFINTFGSRLKVNNQHEYNTIHRYSTQYYCYTSHITNTMAHILLLHLKLCHPKNNHHNSIYEIIQSDTNSIHYNLYNAIGVNSFQTTLYMKQHLCYKSFIYFLFLIFYLFCDIYLSCNQYKSKYNKNLFDKWIVNNNE